MITVSKEHFVLSEDPMSSFFSRFMSKTTEKKPVKLTPAQAQQKMTNEPVTIIDVRRPDEFAEGHIPGAVNLPNETISHSALAALPDEDAVLLVYCRSGHRSAQAVAKLVRLGYKQVYDFGGLLQWPYEITKEDQA
ncbi:rhodanese-like domain-containing protein [Holdemania filiformis]|uniref:Rhodanese-like domain-containing protein n=2 Tax=Holdemania filiformis TaxID=61171 RepID=A0A412FSA3_9FIRM|nr:rhodanese-like domain-containing protein [Holdemania filiformis]RGR70994.1 rhodanese-like domain-containing protein [Holdemania filiformis]